MSTVVETASGKVSGSVVEDVLSFKTIPYGASTTGANRFLPPAPVAAWSGVRDCSEFTGRAPQAGLRPATRPELENFSGAADPSPETEDCLTLNVWTPGCDGAAKRPVMVWFHGGAFAYGNANSPRTRGSRLAARNDVVVVTVNQRLNIFGHLDLSDVGGEAYRHSGNAGTLDMVAALQWVRDNIAAFGGDPGNVTIFGESGGGAKVSTLLSMPAAKGLFHRAIIQSGAAVRLRTRQRALALTACVVQHFGSLAAVKSAGVADLLAAIGPAEKALGPSPFPLFDRYPFGPVVDGDVLPAQPFDPVASDICADVPLIIGDMKTETTSFLAVVDRVWNRTLDEAELRQRVAAIAGKNSGRVLDLYSEIANPAERLIAITTDSNFRIRSLVLAQRRAALRRGPVWMYSFEWETPVLGGKLGAPHAMDVPFCFNTLDLTNATGGSPEAQVLADTMSSVWAAFARNGRPDHPSIPAWPVYDAGTHATLMLDVACRVENDPGGPARRLWQDITGTHGA